MDGLSESYIPQPSSLQPKASSLPPREHREKHNNPLRS